MKKILVLEDNITVSKLVERIIKALEVKVEIFAFDNLYDAYRCALEKEIDCFIVDIILDLKVPGDTSGLKFVDCIRKISRYVLTPVIIMTALEDAKMYTYEKLHCYSYLEKPFEPEQLKNLLEEIFGVKSKKETKTLYFNSDNIIMAADINDIVYVETRKRGLRINTQKLGSLEVPYKTIKKFLDEADCGDLIQCSRFCVVNREYVKNYDTVNLMIELINNLGKVEVGRKFKREVEEGLKKC